MSERGRTVRYTPVTKLPTSEVHTQMERLINSLWSFADCVGMELGQKPTIISRGPVVSFPPITLARLCELEIEVLATTHLLGLGSAMSRGTYELTRNKPTVSPNFKTIVDETWPDLDNRDDEEDRETSNFTD